MEHLRTAIKMLSERRLFDADAVGHMNLFWLLESGIPVDLPDGKQLVIERLSAGSPWAGGAVGEASLGEKEIDWEIVAVLREEHLLLPHPNTIMQPGDQLLILIPPAYREELERRFASDS